MRPGSGADSIRETFTDYTVTRLQALGQDRWLMRLQNDPGPEAVAALVDETTMIQNNQPNYLYEQQVPRRPGAPR